MLGGRRGYVDLIPGDPYKDIGGSYVITKKGKDVLNDYYDGEKYLLDRIRRYEESKKAEGK
jgi:hypothetical protein